MTGTQLAVLVIFLLFDLSLLGILAFVVWGNNLNSVLNTVLPYYYVPCLIWYCIAWFLFGRYSGPLKRGVLIWRENLPEDMQVFFHHLAADIVDQEDGFIRTDGTAAIVRKRPTIYWRTAWPYVAYIDLQRSRLRIEYRTLLPGLLIFLPVFFNLFVALAVVGSLVVNHLVEKRAIIHFISDSMLSH